MKIYCLPLELIAFAIHPGDTQSTTTVCLDGPSRCLYMTSQSNFDFAGVKIGKVHDIIDFLIVASREHRRGAWNEKKCIEDFWVTHCTLADKLNATDSQKVASSIDKIYTGLYTQLWKKFLAANYDQATLQQIKGTIRDVAVINDTDISYSTAIDRTGVHGESRLIRFLFIRDYPTIYLAKTGTFFYLLPGQALSQQEKDTARTWFKEKIRNEQLAMGSSQGTCLGCCACLDEFSISHGDAANNPKQWLDPLTLCGSQGTTPIIKSDSHHAIFVAFRYLAR